MFESSPKTIMDRNGPHDLDHSVGLNVYIKAYEVLQNDFCWQEYLDTDAAGRYK
jgi:hypothetical protein